MSYSKKLTIFYITFAVFCCSSLKAQEPTADQLGFSELKQFATDLAQKGRLKEATPLLEELVSRIEASEESNAELDYVFFLLGAGYIQHYIGTKNIQYLTTALTWYDRLEKEYPRSKNLKASLLKKIELFRAIKKTDQAISLMQDILAGKKAVTLSFPEEIKLLKDLSEIFYSQNRLEKGLPYFTRLTNTARSTEDRALGAAASFEGLIKAKELDQAISLLPFLVKESDVRYRPRLNVALLKASDTMVEEMRYTDAALLLNLIKTTDMMIRYNEEKIINKEAALDRLKLSDSASDRTEKLEQEIKNLHEILKKLRDLPSLRNDLLVRRARNFSITNRPYESFWMFFDLYRENPEHKSIEFYHYASFSGARKIKKHETAIALAHAYRNNYPNGDYYSDITSGLVDTLEETGAYEEMLAIIVDFLNERPMDAFSAKFLSIWANRLFQDEQFEAVIEQCRVWKNRNEETAYADGLYYWSGLAHVQLSDFAAAIEALQSLLSKFPSSVYTPDGTLRLGISHFYEQNAAPARTVLTNYTERYPNSESIDQAYYFLGEVESLDGYPDLAISYFKKADALTRDQSVHDGVAFRIGQILEASQRHEEMLDHFLAYIERFDKKGQLIDALFQVGRAYELLNQPIRMLSLYQESIIKYAQDSSNHGVDSMIEAYVEKYETNLRKLKCTVGFLDRMCDDLEFRTLLVTDRGALFEEFYYNSDLIQELYNNLRETAEFNIDNIENHPFFSAIGSAYREQFENFPQTTPETFFRTQLGKYQKAEQPIAEARMLMGLYRCNVVLEPLKPFEDELMDQFSPRLLLYAADSLRDQDIEKATEAWEKLLMLYPQDEATIVANLRLASVKEEAGQLEGALDYLKQAADTFPWSPKLPLIILRQGELMTRLNRTAEARELYQYILSLPAWRGVFHARALLQTGQSYMAEEAYPEAHGFFERTFLAYSNFADWCARAYLADADALLKMGEQESAANTLDEALVELKGKTTDELYQALKEKRTSIPEL